tara:strand:- start:288 stop:422 length:135 start_codon:yes stop_codon:yes gene_type:complete
VLEIIKEKIAKKNRESSFDEQTVTVKKPNDFNYLADGLSYSKTQ